MAFPVIESSATTGRTGAETTSPVTYPATITAGALLICLFRSAVAGAIGWPGGWNELVEDSSDASDDVTAIAWMAAVGNEDGGTFNVTHGNGKAAAIVHSITGAANPATQPPELSTVAIAAGDPADVAMNPTICTPTGGAKDYLWLFLGAFDGEMGNPTNTPTNYTTMVIAGTGAGGLPATNCKVISFQRNLNASSEDPPAWTATPDPGGSAGVGESSWCMAVHPPTASAGNLACVVALGTAEALNAGMLGKAQLSGVVAMATGNSPNSTIFGKALLSGVLATAIADSPVAALLGGAPGTLVCVLAEATAATLNSIILGKALLATQLATVTAESLGSTLWGKAILPASVIDVIGESPAASILGKAVLLALVSQATVQALNGDMTGKAVFAAQVANVNVESLVSTFSGGGGSALPPATVFLLFLNPNY